MTTELPDWAEDLARKAAEMHSATQIKEVSVRELTPVLDYTLFFAEWVLRDGDLLIHLFPRAGEEDEWFDGHYIDRCIACRREVPSRSDPAKMQRCPHCKATAGLVYVPARRETPVKGLAFPESMNILIKQAADAVWFGDAMMDFVPELRAWVVRFVRAAGVQAVAEEKGLLDRFLTRLDDLLDPRGT